MNHRFTIKNIEDFVKSVSENLGKGRLEKPSELVYYMSNGGAIAPSNLVNPSYVDIYGTSQQHIRGTFELLGGLEENGN